MATITVTSHINSTKILKDIKSVNAGLFAANEAMRIMRPFVPQRTKQLVDSARAHPWAVEYIANHSLAVYYGGRNGNARFRKDLAVFASKEWDKAAEKAGQFEKVSKALQEYYNKNL